MKAINRSGLWKKRLGDWVVNPYVGCAHGCRFCYAPAMPGVKLYNGSTQKARGNAKEGGRSCGPAAAGSALQGHREQEDWGTWVEVKEGGVEAVRRELRTFTPEKAKMTEWGDGWVLVSFLTDPYQSMEREKKVTREVVRLLLEAGHKVRIQTRSTLVERDFDLLARYPGQVLLGTSLTGMSEGVEKVLEPGASPQEERYRMLRRAMDGGLRTYVVIAPVMPWLETKRLDELLSSGIACGADRIFCEVLNPKGSNIEIMANALEKTGFEMEAEAMRGYGPERWARWTYQVSRYLKEKWPMAFWPWPDTGRGWARYLSGEEAYWLGLWLPEEGKQ